MALPDILRRYFSRPNDPHILREMGERTAPETPRYSRSTASQERRDDEGESSFTEFLSEREMDLTTDEMK